MRAEDKNSARVIERLEVGPLLTNCYILKSGDEMVVIDPGGDAEAILGRAEKLGGVVKFIINTHGHIDHIAANGEVAEHTNAPILIHKLDGAMLVSPDANLSLMMGMRIKSPQPSRFLVEGDEIVIGDETLKVIHTPGHTPGSICLLGSDYAFTGDTLFLDSIGRVDLPGGSEMEMQASLVRLQGLLRKETMLYPGHGNTGTFGRALLINPFLGSAWSI
ncbi:MAG: MBL fold metallo-hydrolase [candidate division WOR-3 bacterium]